VKSQHLLKCPDGVLLIWGQLVRRIEMASPRRKRLMETSLYESPMGGLRGFQGELTLRKKEANATAFRQWRSWLRGPDMYRIDNF